MGPWYEHPNAFLFSRLWCQNEFYLKINKNVFSRVVPIVDYVVEIA